MEAQQLIDNAPYDSATLKIIRVAFEQVWADIEGNFGDHPEMARVRLAKLMLTIPADKITSVAQVRHTALELMARYYRVAV
jgi:hypothetical protein